MRAQRKQWKREVRDILRTGCPAAYRITLLHLLLVEGVAIVVELATGNLWQQAAQLLDQGLDGERVVALVLSRIGPVGLFFNILMIFYSAVMDYGYRRWALNVTRGAGEHKDLTEGFSLAPRVLLLRLGLALHEIMIAMLVGIPALLMSVLTENRIVIGLIFGAAAAVAALYILRYQLAYYCMMDDEEHGVFRALRRSVQLTRGRTVEFLLLVVSFAGWLLLPGAITMLVGGGLLMLTGGVSALTDAARTGEMPELISVIASVSAWPVTAWVTPYVTMTICRYYDRLRAAEEAPDGEQAEV